MRSQVTRLASGVAAALLTYALTGVVTITRIATLLPDPGPKSGTTVLDAYHAAGSPVWQAIGWFTLNVNGIPINIDVESGRLVSSEVFLTEQTWLGLLHEWYALIPIVACLLVGLTIALRSNRPGLIPLSIGVYMIPGYAISLLFGTVLFSGVVGPVDASFTLMHGFYPFERWVIPLVVFPLVGGWLGAILGQSPVLRSRLVD